MRSRWSPKQTIVATAHKIARNFYHVLKHRTLYDNLGGEDYERRARERKLRNLERRAAKLGMTFSRNIGRDTTAVSGKLRMERKHRLVRVRQWELLCVGR